MTRAQINAVKAAAWTALWVFLALFGTSLLGWLQDVTKWATDDGGAVVFPDPGVLVKALVAAVASAFSFVVAAIIRLAQATNLLPGAPPAYPVGPTRADRGQTDLVRLGVFLLLLAIALAVMVYAID